MNLYTVAGVNTVRCVVSDCFVLLVKVSEVRGKRKLKAAWVFYCIHPVIVLTSREALLGWRCATCIFTTRRYIARDRRCRMHYWHPSRCPCVRTAASVCAIFSLQRWVRFVARVFNVLTSFRRDAVYTHNYNKTRQNLFCVGLHSIEYFTHRNLASSDASCRSLSGWHVVPILEVSRVLLGNGEVRGHLSEGRS